MYEYNVYSLNVAKCTVDRRAAPSETKVGNMLDIQDNTMWVVAEHSIMGKHGINFQDTTERATWNA
jgi:hypothetical protein